MHAVSSDRGARARFHIGHTLATFGAGAQPLSIQRDDPASFVQLHHPLIHLRRANPALCQGRISDVRANGLVLSYMRSLGGCASC